MQNQIETPQIYADKSRLTDMARELTAAEIALIGGGGDAQGKESMYF